MKKILLIVVLAVVCTALIAEIEYYGSARVGFWYDVTDEDHVREERVNNDISLQEDSHFGINFKFGDLHAKAEVGYCPEEGVRVDYLWARHYFRNWALVVGKDDFGSSILANQAWGSGKGLNGYGALDAGTIPQVRFELNIDSDMLYFALMQPNVVLPHKFIDGEFVVDPAISRDDIDVLIPRIMVGYNVYNRDFRLYPMVMFQMYQISEDMTGLKADDIVSWLISVTAESYFWLDRVILTLHGHYGQNIGHFGYTGAHSMVLGHQAGTRYQTARAENYGGFMAVTYNMSNTFSLNGGVGYSETDTTSEHRIGGERVFTHHDNRLAAYLQGVSTIGNFSVLPEVGYMYEGRDLFGNKQGSQIYFGSQLRFDF